MELVESVKLLTAAQLRALFPGATVARTDRAADEVIHGRSRGVGRPFRRRRTELNQM